MQVETIFLDSIYVMQIQFAAANKSGAQFRGISFWLAAALVRKGSWIFDIPLVTVGQKDLAERSVSVSDSQLVVLCVFTFLVFFTLVQFEHIQALCIWVWSLLSSSHRR